ncbi:MAG: hypothetical protein A3F84_11205 [Candidatus Handelsmanbacteria bacterium RIFCSPLOWO2_12_FULL_64_10]|uniref:acylphosphatase n=1 Tax=Handelsmanbacteria sp. (strain RIFCSPLOWO2_12_FULL_64_10) TaxID=1817868 RepID=A0A1F6C717_HANXR|nr:MAG: hypothetical protein A3F84_11205 [Candidatus Handelsmanbacteria bacterium RIFCSPLOWO2_12_FULL_64_10]
MRARGPDEVAAHLIVHGRVQGVGYRISLWQQARDRGVRGWTCNLEDGSVEVVLQGSVEEVGALVAWTHHGPPSARVKRVDVRRIDPSDALDGFEIRG